jgi:hypothetical protein
MIATVPIVLIIPRANKLLAFDHRYSQLLRIYKVPFSLPNLLLLSSFTTTHALPHLKKLTV